MKPVLIPLEANGKRPTTRGWASVSWAGADEIPAGSNVGLRTDGIVVIDCDNAEASEWWAVRSSSDFQVATPRGRHFYYRLPEGVRWRPGPLADHIDIKTGPGAYVLIPPSKVGGRAYAWGERWDFDPASLPVAPAKLIDSLLGAQRPEAAEPDSGWDIIPEGRRNVTLTALAGALRRQGAGAEAIGSVLATMNAKRCSPPLEDHELVTIIRSVLRYESDPDEADGDIELLADDDVDNLIEHDDERPNVIWADRLEIPPPPRWHYPPYIPAARLILMDGNEGIGKGMFATWAAVNMASGAFGQSSPVLWGSTEDDPAEDILRRLYAAGYDPKTHAGIGFLNGDGLYWRYPGDIGALAALVREVGARLLILDPGRSFLGPPPGMSPGEFSYNNEAHMRPGLEALNLLARKLDVAVLFIHHWNKNLTASIRVRSGGSGAFAQTVRHRVTLDYLGGEHALAVEKSNMTSREYTVMGYDLEEVEELATARFVWGEPHPAVDLDEWETQVKGSDDLSDAEQLDVAVGFVADAAERELERGSRFWNRDELQERFGLSQKAAKNVIAAMREQGYLQRGAGNVLAWAPEQRSVDA